jgi:ubiquinone/menaquinone biosynthesis C-methylase UbiE
MQPNIQRVSRSKEAARANYNRLSRWYDLVSGSTEKKYRDIGLARLSAQPGEHVLEIGFGTGHCILALALAVSETGKVTGIDISEGMLQIARQRIAQAGLGGWVELYNVDAASLPFEKDTFDAIFMSFTLELFDTPEIPQVLQQCWKVLRPGGRLCTVTMAKKAKDTLPVRIYEWFHEKMPAAVDCRPIFAQQALNEAGFELTHVTEMLMWGLPVEIIIAAKPDQIT